MNLFQYEISNEIYFNYSGLRRAALLVFSLHRLDLELLHLGLVLLLVLPVLSLLHLPLLLRVLDSCKLKERVENAHFLRIF